MNEEDKTRRYLGDGVYVSCDGYQLRLTTENGISVQNEIFLEPGVYQNLVNYVESFNKGETK